MTAEPLALGKFVTTVLLIHFRAADGVTARVLQDQVGLSSEFEAGVARYVLRRFGDLHRDYVVPGVLDLIDAMGGTNCATVGVGAAEGATLAGSGAHDTVRGATDLRPGRMVALRETRE